MKISLRTIRSNTRAVSVTEFALIAPLLLTAILGIGQLGIMFFANAGMRSAVGEGARFATIFPRPTDNQIKAKVASNRFGIKPQNLSPTVITHGQTDGGDYVDIQMSYNVPLDFVFFSVPPVRLVATRRAFVQPVV